MEDEETLAVTYETATLADYDTALKTLDSYGEEPDPANYGVWVPGIPVLVGNGLEAANAAPWLSWAHQQRHRGRVGACWLRAADAGAVPAAWRFWRLRLYVAAIRVC